MSFNSGEIVKHKKSGKEMTVVGYFNDPKRESVFAPGGKQTGPEKKKCLCKWDNNEDYFEDDELEFVGATPDMQE